MVAGAAIDFPWAYTRVRRCQDVRELVPLGRPQLSSLLVYAIGHACQVKFNAIIPSAVASRKDYHSKFSPGKLGKTVRAACGLAKLHAGMSRYAASAPWW